MSEDRSPRGLVGEARRLHTKQLPRTQAKMDELTAQRDAAVSACHAAGMTYAEIAAELGVSVSYVQIMVQRSEGRPSPSRRPEFRSPELESAASELGNTP